jgi:NodT family efflux transporter outer membrane factor (OMF) lipoprotein
MKRMPVLLAAAGSLALAACTVGPDHRPPVTASAAAGPFLAAGSPAFTAAAPADDWWRLYEDPVLDGLVADALAANTDLRAASANLQRVQAIVRETRAGRVPQIRLATGVTYGQNSAILVPPGVPRRAAVFDAGLEVAWEVDLFGRIARAVEAAEADAAAAAALQGSVRLMVVAETTRAYADAAAATEQLAVAERNVALIEETLAVTSRRHEAGRGTRIDVARVATLRDREQAGLPPLKAARDGALFRLSALTGRPPADLPPAAWARKSTLRLDQAIPVGDGRTLLARRPDVHEAERQLAAETARVGVATADLYPRISLGGSVGATGLSLADLFSGGPFRWLLGPLIGWSFPNQEVERARIVQARASAAGALARFDGTVLHALAETETALSAYANELDRRRSLQSARGEAAGVARIARAQLREGRIDGLAVLDAERSLAQAEAELAAADAAIVGRQIDLFRALGGGWTAPAGLTEQPPPEGIGAARP